MIIKDKSKYKYKKYKNKQWLEEQYLINKKSYKEIALEIGCTSKTIGRWIKFFDIPIRIFKHNNNEFCLYKNIEWLKTQYINNHRSASNIANECSCNLSTILYWIRKFNIHVRTNSEAHIGLPIVRTEKRISAWAKNSGNNHPMKRKEISIKITGKNNGMNQLGIRKKHLSIVNDPIYKENKRQKVLKMWENPIKHIEASERFKGPKNPNYGKPPNIGTQWSKGMWYVFSNETKIWIRSSYELRVIESLSKFNIKWEYEKQSFDVNELGTWHPDFYLPEYDLWWEIKGYMQEEALNKILCFIKLYPDKILKILYLDDILELECYKDNNWKFDIYSIGNDIHDNQRQK